MANPELVEDGEELIVVLLLASDYKFIDSGIGTTAPIKANTGMESACAEARDSAVQSEGDTASIYKLVVTHTYNGIFAITEAGVFSVITAGVLFIRGTFAAINVSSGDKIEFTITLEIL